MPALAATRSGDAAATRAYLQIAEAQARLFAADGPGVAAVQALQHQIAGECPDALAYAPRDVAYEEIGEEVGDVIAVTFDEALVPRAEALAQVHELSSLKWSSRELTRLVGGLANEERGFTTAAAPNLCAQIAGWRESAYVALPAASSSFLAAMNAAEQEFYVGPGEEVREKAIAHLLERHERPAERRRTMRLLRLERQDSARIGAWMNAVAGQFAGALGVSTL